MAVVGLIEHLPDKSDAVGCGPSKKKKTKEKKAYKYHRITY